MQIVARNRVQKGKTRPGLYAWRQLLANRGPVATVQAAARVVRHRLDPAAPFDPPSELWRNPGLLPARLHPFDQTHGTETSGLTWGENLQSGHAHDAWNTAYYGIAPSIFAQAMAAVHAQPGFDPAKTTFIDLGSGKGRAVMLAAQLPFARVLGVELNPRLHAVACANLARFAPAPTYSTPELLLADAAAFPWPDQLELPPQGPLLLFLYNPFARPVLRELLRRVQRELVRSALGEVSLLYINPELDDEIARHPWITKTCEKTVPIDGEDRLADRFGSTCETFALYRCLARSNAAR
jgi:SAM-dependent methyltransferase